MKNPSTHKFNLIFGSQLPAMLIKRLLSKQRSHKKIRLPPADRHFHNLFQESSENANSPGKKQSLRSLQRSTIKCNQLHLLGWKSPASFGGRDVIKLSHYFSQHVHLGIGWGDNKNIRYPTEKRNLICIYRSRAERRNFQVCFVTWRIALALMFHVHCFKIKRVSG